MLIEQKTVQLKDGRMALLRSPLAEDAAAMLDYLKTCSAETDFILRYPEECVETREQEESFLTGINQSETTIMIVCVVDGEIAGNCQIVFYKRKKYRHKASIAIAIVKKYWNLGIGTVLFEEMIAIAKQRGVMQLELGFMEGNARGRALYEKMGFQIVTVTPDVFCMRDGSLRKEYFMMKKL